MEGGEKGSSAIHVSVMNSVSTTLANVENLKTHLLQFLSLSNPDVLAELPPEQRQSMRQISKGEGARNKYSDSNVKRKRKYESSEKQSVQNAAKEFLEKAARELFGDKKDGFKGPLQADASDEDLPLS